MNLDLNSLWFFYPGAKTKCRVASGCNLLCEHSQKLPGRALREGSGEQRGRQGCGSDSHLGGAASLSHRAHLRISVVWEGNKTG